MAGTVSGRTIACMVRHGMESAFRHEALIYKGDDTLVRSAAAFIEEGLAGGEQIVVALPASTAQALSSVFADEESVSFVEPFEVARNPARILPFWREYLDRGAAEGRGVRRIGQSVWRGRSAAELDECILDEALLNYIHEQGPPLTALCAYDGEGISPELAEGVAATHPVVGDGEGVWESDAYGGADLAVRLIARPLPEPPPPVEEILFEVDGLAYVRDVVGRRAAAAGLDLLHVQELVLAVHELATNSVQYAGGKGVLRMWQEGSELVCEVRDDGHITDPLAGRVAPSPTADAGRGLWVVNQLCDLLQIRSSPAGTVARVRA
jgi:anti-sigma regulatory factor (Ser/Thr protein kinase)